MVLSKITEQINPANSDMTKTRANTSSNPPPKNEAKNGRKLTPRRTPNQDRSRNTVATILQAAGHSIERDGLDRLTTRRIAAMAEISVGALYEYFPNKQSIVYALVNDWMAKSFKVLDDLHPMHGGKKDILSYLGSQIDQITQLYRNQPGLGTLITMAASVPELGETVRAHDERIANSVSSAFLYFAPQADPLDAISAARTIAIIAHEIICEAVARHAPDSDRLIRNLKICVFALGTRLLLPR